MRILHVTPYYEGAWAYGGIPRAASVTVRGLVALGHDVTVCTTDACRSDARLPRNGRLAVGTHHSGDVKVFPNLSNAAAYYLQFFLPRGLGTFLRTNARNFDVAHLHGCHHVPGALASRCLRRAHVPYVLTPHGTAPYLERRRTAKRLFDATIGRGVLATAARIIAVSDAERRQLIDFGVPAADLMVIPNPVDASEFDHVTRGAFRRIWGIAPDERLVLFLGKLTAQKKLDTLVEAFAALGHANTRLVIAGNDMGYGRILQRLVDTFRIRQRTVLTGLLTGRERLQALADADVVAYASENEAFGLVPLEAVLCGTPVIVSNDSGCAELMGRVGGALLVPPGDTERLRDALEQILNQPGTWRALAADAQERARQYSSDRVCETLEAMYAQVVHEAREPRLCPAL
jgi:glycosyltransferase involved in cell wall biosynthesis